jgi:hypothetical protein
MPFTYRGMAATKKGFQKVIALKRLIAAIYVNKKIVSWITSGY